MSENKLVFKLHKHKKLWEAMPDYILDILRDPYAIHNMTSVINLAKRRAITDLFPEEGYVVYDCFACQYTKIYGELFLEEADEKNCKYCPLAWKDDLKCGYRGNLLYLLERMNPGKISESRLRNLCKKITELPVREGVETDSKLETDLMDINEKCQMLPLIKTQKSKWVGGSQPDGTSHFSFPVYSKPVEDWIHALYELKLTDKNYYENMEKIKDKPIDQLTRDEILTRMTYLIRAERFCDGTIEAALNNGTLEALSTRLHEITK